MPCPEHKMDGGKPIILLLGEIVLAHKEWDELRAIAELRQVSAGSRDQFLRDLEDGVYDRVMAISRTWDSTEFTGRFDQTVISRLPKSLKSISHNGAGYDSIDATACAARGISVSNTPGAVDASTASIAIWLMLGALRRTHIPYTAIRAGCWRGRMQLTHDPENKLLGILGMGGIGTAVAKRAVPFGMSIQYYNRHEVSKEKNTIGAKYVGFEELLRTSDIISVHLPLNESTRGMIGRRELAMMKDGVVIVNTARGPVVDESALVEALESGKVWGAGLDVYEREPNVHEGLLRNDHCVLMPHVGTASFETQRKMEQLVIQNLASVIKTGNLLTPVAECKTLKATTNTNGVTVAEHTKTPTPPTNNSEDRGGTESGIRGENFQEFTATTTTAKTNGIAVAEHTESPKMRRRGTETETLAEKLHAPAAAMTPNDQIQRNGIKPQHTVPNVPKTNGVIATATTTTTTTATAVDGLWEPPKAPPKRTATNWLEFSPRLDPKDKDHAMPDNGHADLENGVVQDPLAR